ncbi:MAG: EAL domain-containing protein, partial [Gammaproteobacteria bacterium]|nr:EAL domain-containing protein [Gammaproteobacteria bacterium]
KIDRSFINDITIDSADRELVSATITMARNLGLHVVAEGVETEEQLAILKELGCEMVQGYLFSKPVPADDIPGLIASFQ